MAPATTDKLNGISSAAVKLRTGKTWSEWIAILDAAGAAAMTHREIVAHLSAKHAVGPWWQQMVTVGYEQFHGRRVKHETTDGFQISRSKTIGVPLAELFAAWKDKRKRSRWLEAEVTIRKATTERSLRITWVDGTSSVSVMFYAKGPGKSQVTVDHTRLANQREADRMKAYWGDQLECLKTMLEK